jgi:hypothetical protein
MKTLLSFKPSLLLLLLLLSCTKEDNNDVQMIYIDASVKSQEFAAGSYWIYRNDSTQITDCTYVYNVGHGFKDQYWGLGRNTSSEYYSILYHHSAQALTNTEDVDRIETYFVMRNPIPCYNGGMSGPGIYKGRPDSTVVVIDSMAIGGQLFRHIQEVTIDSTVYYTAKSVGIIKKVVSNSVGRGTWEIVRYKIVQDGKK